MGKGSIGNGKREGVEERVRGREWWGKVAEIPQTTRIPSGIWSRLYRLLTQ